MTPITYIGGMKKEMHNGVEAQGAETQAVEVPTIEKIEGYLRKDLGVAIKCLEAIHSDPDLIRSMATFLMGRFENHLLKKEVGNKPVE